MLTALLLSLSLEFKNRLLLYLQAAVALYQDAIGRLPTPKMYDLFTAFLTEQLQQQRRDAEGEGEQASKQAAQVAADQLTGQLLAAYEQAHAAGGCSGSYMSLLAHDATHDNARIHSAQAVARAA